MYIMSKMASSQEKTSEIHHYERLEFLGDAVIEFLSRSLAVILSILYVVCSTYLNSNGLHAACLPHNLTFLALCDSLAYVK